MAGFSDSLMSADRYAHQVGGYEPQRQNNAILRIYGLDDAAALELCVDTFPLPKQQNGIIEFDWLNEKRKVAGKVTIDDMEVVFKDFVDKDTALMLWKWRLKVYDPKTGKVGLAQQYKKSADAVLFAPDGTLQRIWAIQGLWPSNMDPGDIDMAGEDIIKISMTLVCDKAVYAAEGGGQTTGGNVE